MTAGSTCRHLNKGVAYCMLLQDLEPSPINDHYQEVDCTPPNTKTDK